MIGKRDFTRLLLDFKHSEAKRVGASPPGRGVLDLKRITSGHISSSIPQVIQVPLPTDSGNEGTQNDSNDPLWPTFDDTATGSALSAEVKSFISSFEQGDIGDCYALSSLNALAESRCSVLRSRIVVTALGTIAVYGFYQGSQAEPVTLEMSYVFGNEGSTVLNGYIAWKAFEKAWAFARFMEMSGSGVITTTTDTYSAENSGWMVEVMSFLGIPTNEVSITSTNLVATATSLLDAGKAVTFGTPSTTTAGYVDEHAYSLMVDYTTTPPTLLAVNPWGTLGGSANPQYIVVKNSDYTNYEGLLVSSDPSLAFPVPVPVPPPLPVPLPVIGNFGGPLAPVKLNTPITFSWRVSGTVSSITITQKSTPASVIYSGTTLSGTISITPPGASGTLESTQYVLTATNATGSVTKTWMVIVLPN